MELFKCVFENKNVNMFSHIYVDRYMYLNIRANIYIYI